MTELSQTIIDMMWQDSAGNCSRNMWLSRANQMVKMVAPAIAWQMTAKGTPVTAEAIHEAMSLSNLIKICGRHDVDCLDMPDDHLAGVGAYLSGGAPYIDPEIIQANAEPPYQAAIQHSYLKMYLSKDLPSDLDLIAA